MALPSDHIYIQTAMSLRGSPSGATIGVHLAPRSSESRHGEWLNTCRLDVHVNEWPAEGYHELMVMARRQVVILSEKLRSASFDFTEAHIKTLPPEPSTHSMITPKNVPLTPCKDINFHRAFTQPPFDRRSSPVQSIEGPLLRACSEKETSSISRLPVNGRRQHRRLSHSESSISRYTLEYTESPHAKDAVPPQGSFPFTHFSTPNFDEATNDPQADDDTVSQKSLWLERETPGGHSHTDNPCMSDIRPTEPSSGENTTPLEKSSPCISAGMIEPKEIQSPPPPTTRAKSNAKGKGKRPGKGSSASKQLQKSSNEGCRRFPPAIDTRYQRTLGKKRFAQAMDVAAKLARLVCQGGTKCVEGGPEFIVQTFQGRDNDLSLLKPDRAALTLEDLGPQQRIYATSLLQTSTIADIVHSWCIIAYEYQLSTRYRDAMTRRDQPKVRSSLRVRSRGIIVAEAHRLLAEAIGADAYKLCPAILAGISAQEPFPCLRVCRDWSTDQLKLIAGVWVNHLLNSEERSWMQIDQEYAIDPAAQIVAKDFFYDDARRALGLDKVIMLPAPFLSRQLPAPNISRQSPTPLLPRLLTAPVLNPQDCFEEERTASFEASTSCEVVDQGNSQQELVAIDCAEDTLFEQNGVSWPLAFEELFTLSPQPSPADNES